MSETITMWQNGFVKGFKLTPYDPNLYANILSQFENKQVQFCIREVPKKPSAELHGYYRGIIIPTALNDEQFRGWRPDDLHKHFKGLFLKEVKELQMGTATVLIVDIESTGSISKKRMAKFLDDVIQYLAEKGITVPEPIKQYDTGK